MLHTVVKHCRNIIGIMCEVWRAFSDDMFDVAEFDVLEVTLQAKEMDKSVFGNKHADTRRGVYATRLYNLFTTLHLRSKSKLQIIRNSEEVKSSAPCTHPVHIQYQCRTGCDP